MDKTSHRHRKLVVAATFAALILLLAIHVFWLFKAARLEEQIFNQRVAIALKEARDEVAVRLVQCIQMNEYLCGKQCAHDVAHNKRAELDSIIHSRLEINNIHLKYWFEINHAHLSSATDKNNCYYQSLSGLLPTDDIHIKVQFPDRSRYVMAQLGGLFVASITFIFLVAISFVVMLRLYHREKLLMQQTIDFINNMVHEFQTPLANIRLATSMIKKRIAGDAKNEEYIQIVQKEHHKLQGHIDKILNVAALGQNNNATEPVDLLQLTRDAADNFRPRITALNGTIGFHYQGTNFILKGNYELLETAWNSLIDNAIKYSPDNVEILLCLTEENGKQTFIVEDQGIGMSTNETKRIFDQYYRVSSGDIHNVKGFGLGLYHTWQIISAYEGKIKVESTLGKGTRFIIEFNQK